MQDNPAGADNDRGGAQADLSAEIQAALALSRATLHAVAALSDAAQTAAEAALEDEADRAGESVRRIVEDARARLQAAPADARMAAALRQVLVAAAAALPADRRVA